MPGVVAEALDQPGVEVEGVAAVGLAGVRAVTDPGEPVEVVERRGVLAAQRRADGGALPVDPFAGRGDPVAEAGVAADHGDGQPAFVLEFLDQALQGQDHGDPVGGGGRVAVPADLAGVDDRQQHQHGRQGQGQHPYHAATDGPIRTGPAPHVAVPLRRGCSSVVVP